MEPRVRIDVKSRVQRRQFHGICVCQVATCQHSVVRTPPLAATKKVAELNVIASLRPLDLATPDTGPLGELTHFVEPSAHLLVTGS